jgi:hypothetical protein
MPQPPSQAPNPRQNEYFIPRDGIDREVITSDICRYLGNDALVRPGTYEDPNSGQSISGYYITAYRNLTTAMIEDLKADSARWEQERRAKSSRNAAGVQYHHSDTYARRQRGGAADSSSYGNSRDSYDSPHTPHSGPEAPGYPGYPPQSGSGQYAQPNPPAGYPGGNTGAYPPGAGYAGNPNPYPQQDPGYAATGQPNMGYSQPQDTWVHGAARPMAQPYREPAQYPPGMGSRDQMMTTPPSQGSYPPPQHPQAAYGGSADYYNAPTGAPTYQSMPQDTLYGRGGSTYHERTTSPPQSMAPDRVPTAAVAQPSGDTHMQGQQYDEPRTHSQPSGSVPPRRQETPRHQPHRNSGRR